MLLKKLWILGPGVALVVAACAAPVTTPAATQVEPTLPPPAAATAAPTAAPPTAAPQPTDTTAEQPTAPPPTPDPYESSATEPVLASVLTGAFVKMEVPVTGSYSLDPAAGVLSFSSDFGVEPGPNLFVVLTAASDLSLDFQSFSEIVNNASVLYLGPLANIAGSQTYTIPTGTDLAQFKSVVVWCRAFSVAFAAAPLQ